jgi:hypothetical protein
LQLTGGPKGAAHWPCGSKNVGSDQFDPQPGPTFLETEAGLGVWRTASVSYSIHVWASGYAEYAVPSLPSQSALRWLEVDGGRAMRSNGCNLNMFQNRACCITLNAGDGIEQQMLFAKVSQRYDFRLPVPDSTSSILQPQPLVRAPVTMGRSPCSPRQLQLHDCSMHSGVLLEAPELTPCFLAFASDSGPVKAKRQKAVRCTTPPGNWLDRLFTPWCNEQGWQLCRPFQSMVLTIHQVWGRHLMYGTLE